MPGVTIIKTSDEYQAAIQSDKLVVVDFTASWCGPCKMIAPKFELLSNDYPGVKFLKLDINEVADVAQAEKIQAMPTFKFFKEGRPEDSLTVVGATMAKLEDSLRRLAASA